MKTITAIESQRGNHQRVNVHLEGSFAFSIDAFLAARENLSVGQGLDEDALSKLARLDAFQRCYDAALHFLGYRPRSEKEVRQRLRKRGFGEEVASEVILKLRDQKFLDDYSFARFWLENRQSFSPRGGRLLKLELRQKGVDSETIGEVTEGIDEAEAAYTAAQKKARSLTHRDYQEFRQNLGAFLQRRGFGYDTISEVVSRLWRERETSS